jgi:hypothetical protein
MFCVDFAGYEEVYGGNAEPKSDSPLQSGLAIRARTRDGDRTAGIAWLRFGDRGSGIEVRGSRDVDRGWWYGDRGWWYGKG